MHDLIVTASKCRSIRDEFINLSGGGRKVFSGHRAKADEFLSTISMKIKLLAYSDTNDMRKDFMTFFESISWENLADYHKSALQRFITSVFDEDSDRDSEDDSQVSNESNVRYPCYDHFHEKETDNLAGFCQVAMKALIQGYKMNKNEATDDMDSTTNDIDSSVEFSDLDDDFTTLKSTFGCTSNDVNDSMIDQHPHSSNNSKTSTRTKSITSTSNSSNHVNKSKTNTITTNNNKRRHKIVEENNSGTPHQTYTIINNIYQYGRDIGEKIAIRHNIHFDDSNNQAYIHTDSSSGSIGVYLSTTSTTATHTNSTTTTTTTAATVKTNESIPCTIKSSSSTSSTTTANSDKLKNHYGKDAYVYDMNSVLVRSTFASRLRPHSRTRTPAEPVLDIISKEKEITPQVTPRRSRRNNVDSDLFYDRYESILDLTIPDSSTIEELSKSKSEKPMKANVTCTSEFSVPKKGRPGRKRKQTIENNDIYYEDNVEDIILIDEVSSSSSSSKSNRIVSMTKTVGAASSTDNSTTSSGTKVPRTSIAQKSPRYSYSPSSSKTNNNNVDPNTKSPVNIKQSNTRNTDITTIIPPPVTNSKTLTRKQLSHMTAWTFRPSSQQTIDNNDKEDITKTTLEIRGNPHHTSLSSRFASTASLKQGPGSHMKPAHLLPQHTSSSSSSNSGSSSSSSSSSSNQSVYSSHSSVSSSSYTTSATQSTYTASTTLHTSADTIDNNSNSDNNNNNITDNNITSTKDTTTTGTTTGNTSGTASSTNNNPHAYIGVKTNYYGGKVVEYMAEAIVCNRILSLGSYATETLAARAHDLALIRAIGPAACKESDLNFPITEYSSVLFCQFTAYDETLKRQLFGSSWTGPKACDFSFLVLRNSGRK